MKRILILGANGQIARVAIDLLIKNTDFELTLIARNAKRLSDLGSTSKRIKVAEGDVQDLKKLEEVLPGHDIVYANLSGSMASQAKNIIDAMKKHGLKRLIFISSMGIYDEVPGQKYKSILDPYRDSALLIEASDLDYTIIRPEWLNNKNEIDYELTQKGEQFKNPEKLVSRLSVADLIVKIAKDPSLENRHSVGINKT